MPGRIGSCSFNPWNKETNQLVLKHVVEEFVSAIKNVISKDDAGLLVSQGIEI